MATASDGRQPQNTDEMFALWRDDPVAFFTAAWPNARLWQKQLEILLSVRDNFGTVVHSSVESGKDWIAARIAWWFYCTRFPCRVICTSSSVGQLRRVLWGEIDRAYRDAAIPLGVDKMHMFVRRLDPHGNPYADDWFQLVAVKAVENLMGTHLASTPDLPRIFVILDEASAVDDKLAELIESQAHRILVIGNPLRTSGYYARIIRRGDVPDEFRPGKFRWKRLHVDARRTPNVAAGKRWEKGGRVGPCPQPMPGLMSYPDFTHHLREWPEFRVQTCLYGKLLDEIGSAVIVPRAWLEYGQGVWDRVDKEHRATLPKFMGIDSFEGGGDLACWAVGDAIGLLDLRSLSGAGIPRDADGLPQTSRLLEITCEMQAKWSIPWENIEVDKGGGGLTSIVAPLRKRGHWAHAISFGRAVPKRLKDQYKNFRACLYGEARKWIDPGLELEDANSPSGPRVARKWLAVENEDGNKRWQRAFVLPPHSTLRAEVEALVDELSLIPRLDDGDGKMFLPPKDRKAGQKTGQCLREMLGHSPDRSDAVVLMLWRMRVRSRSAMSADYYKPAPKDYDVRKSDLWEWYMGKAKR